MEISSFFGGGVQEGFQGLWGKEKIKWLFTKAKKLPKFTFKFNVAQKTKRSFTSSKMLPKKISHLDKHMVRKNGQLFFKLWLLGYG